MHALPPGRWWHDCCRPVRVPFGQNLSNFTTSNHFGGWCVESWAKSLPPFARAHLARDLNARYSRHFLMYSLPRHQVWLLHPCAPVLGIEIGCPGVCCM